MTEKKLMVKLGTKIRERRKYQEMTQKQLAKKLGVHAPAVCMWELGVRSPGFLQLISLESVLGPLWPIL